MSLGPCKNLNKKDILLLTKRNSFPIIPIFIFLLISVSCSHHQKIQSIPETLFFTAPNHQRLNLETKRICFEGEGKGRFSLAEDGHSFGHESKLDLDNQIWSIGVHVPFYGDELLNISWKGENKVSGGLYQKIKEQLSKRKKAFEGVTFFFNKIADAIELLITLRDDPALMNCDYVLDQNKRVGGSCKSMSSDGNLLLTGMNNTLTFKFIYNEFSNLVFIYSKYKSTKFNRLIIRLEKNQKIDNPLKDLSSRFELLFTSC